MEQSTFVSFTEIIELGVSMICDDKIIPLLLIAKEYKINYSNKN